MKFNLSVEKPRHKITEEPSKDSVKYRRVVHEARECPKMQDRATVPLNNRETASKGSFSNEADMDLNGNLYEKNVQVDYAALAALDVDGWVDSYCQTYNEEDNDGYCHENDIKRQDRLRGSPICREFLESTQRQMNPERMQLHTLGFSHPLKHIPRVENMQPAQLWEYIQSTSRNLQNAQNKKDKIHLRRSGQEGVSRSVTSKGFYRVQKPPIRSGATRRGGRPVPPAVTDLRWNIWTLGDMDIRYNHGGVTVKHLQQVLFALDGNKRTKHDYASLKTQVVDKRNQFKGFKPLNWKPTQGWWVHLEPE